jgi:hypothetical protein
MSRQTQGTITVDNGHRTAVAGGTPDGATSRVEQRARNAMDSLGALGLPQWHLPGFGEEGPKCGEWYISAVCETCAEPDMATHDCGRRGCPNCWGKWAQDAAVRRTVRLQARRLAEPADYHRQSGHFVYSPNDPVESVEDIKELRRDAAATAQEKGMRALDVVVHPFRLTEEAERVWERVEDKVDVGKWVYFRNQCPERMQPGEDSLLRWSPHAHCIGLMSPDMDAGDGEGAVWSLLSTFGSMEGKRDRDSHEEVFGAYRYLLSHVGIHDEEQFNAVTGYGSLSNVKFREFRPSDGVMSVLEREVEEAVGAVLEPDEEEGAGGEDDEIEPCPQDGCDGDLVDVWDIPMYLEQCDPPPEVRAAMQLAHDWRMGEVVPPPGLKHPQTEEDAREAWSVMLDA